MHRLEDHVASWTVALEAAVRTPAPRGRPDWENASALTPDDAEPLLDFLERRTDGRLRFTSGAARTWRKSGYLHPQLTRSALFPHMQGGTTERLPDWFRDNLDLDVATTDAALK